MRFSTRIATFFFLAVILAACFQDKKADILAKASGAGTTEALSKALGDPDEVNKLGPLEQWIYKAADGEVVFSIVAGKVTLEHTADTKKQ